MKNIAIESTFPAVLTNQAKLEELHDLRTVKKLRYLWNCYQKIKTMC
jgi:CHAD domain-containing protein